MNEQAFDFASLENATPAQDFALLRGAQGVVEYPVRVIKFANVNSITLHFKGSFGGERSSVFYIGFKVRRIWFRTIVDTADTSHVRLHKGESKVLKKDAQTPLTQKAETAADAPIDSIRETARPAQSSIR